MVFPLNGIVLSNENEQTTNTKSSMYESQKLMLCERSQTQENNGIYYFTLYDFKEQAKLVSADKYQSSAHLGCTGTDGLEPEGASLAYGGIYSQPGFG